MMRAFLFAITVANAVVVTTATKTPTQAPTKSDAEKSLLAECKASRTGGLSDTYTTPEATALRQEYRNGYFNVEAKLDKFDFNMEETMSDPTGAENQALATEYVMALLWSSLWPALLVFISIAFFLPVTCCKWWGECTAHPTCCLHGKGCCGSCNDFFCGFAKCPHFGVCDGFCRYAPIADYPTFGCTASYEHDPNIVSDESSCGSKKIELEDGHEYHERDGVYGQRVKPMESRFAIPNLVWLALMVTFGVGTYVCGITGQVNTVTMIEGLKTTATEGSCIIADAIDFVEQIQAPIFKMSTLAQEVIGKTSNAISAASNLGTSMTAIATAMTDLGTHINTDSCGFVASGVVSSWPPTALGDASTAVTTAAAGVDAAAAGIVDTLDGTLGSVQVMLIAVNGTLTTAVAEADKALDPAMKLLRETASPINEKVATVLELVTTWQGTFVQVLFGLIFGLAGLIVVFSTIWLACTELYECEQKKETSATGDAEPEGEGDEDEPSAHGCKDCLCSVFQVNCVAAHHLLYVLGWIMMMLCFMIALIFNPVTIVMSDACVGIDHFAQHSTRWLTSPGSEFANETLMIDALGSCMDIQKGNLLNALGVSSVLTSFTNVSFGGASAIDINVDFSAVDTLVTDTGAITLSSVADFPTKADEAITLMNTAITKGGAGATYTTSPPEPDTRCYSAAASAVCTLTSFSTCTCAQDTAYTTTSTKAAEIKTARDAVIKIWDTKVCTSTYITTMQSKAAAIKVLTDALKTDIAFVKNALGNADTQMTPVKDQIKVLHAAGSCAFVRRRLNGMLNGVCGGVMEGTVLLTWDLTLIGAFLFGLLFMVQMCAVSRFRMYDVACWHHDHTEGCGGEGADGDDEIEMTKTPMTRVGGVV